MKNTLKPSQWINFGYILIGIIAGPFTLGLSLLIPIWNIIETHFIYYQFYDDKIIYKRGVFSVHYDEILLYRIKSISLNKPFLYRIVGIANINIISSDPTIPCITLNAIPVDIEFRNLLRNVVEENRKIKGIKEFDLYNL